MTQLSVRFKMNSLRPSNSSLNDLISFAIPTIIELKRITPYFYITDFNCLITDTPYRR